MNRRFRTGEIRYVVPDAAGGQDVQDTVDQPARVGRCAALSGEVFPNNFPRDHRQSYGRP